MPETASATYLRSSRLLEVNPVSLSLFRIALGACVLLHIWLTLPHYTTFFTDDGVLPRSVVTQVWNKPEVLSVLLLGDHPLLHSGFMVVYVLAAVCFCIGYHTWLANILLVCCVTSLNWRNPLISGEVTGHASLLLKLLLIWCCFLPMNYFFSVDAARGKARKPYALHVLPFLAIRLQISSIYLFSGLFKLSGPNWLDGSAVYNALLDNAFARTPAGLWLTEHAAGMLPALTYSIIAFQLLFVFLVYSPFFNNLTRFVAISGALLMHHSFMVFLNLRFFPILCIAYLILLIPDSWWIHSARVCRFSRLKEWLVLQAGIISNEVGSPPSKAGNRLRLKLLFCSVLAVLALISNLAATPIPAFLKVYSYGSAPVTDSVTLNMAGVLQVRQSWPLFWNVSDIRQLRVSLMVITSDNKTILFNQQLPGNTYWVDDSGTARFKQPWNSYFMAVAMKRDEAVLKALTHYYCRLNRDAEGNAVHVVVSDIALYRLPSDFVLESNENIRNAIRPSLAMQERCP